MGKPPKTYIPLDHAPKHAAAIGQLLGHWAFLEYGLIELLTIFLHVDLLKATIIYQGFVSTKAKILLIQRLNHIFMPDKDLKKELHELLKKVSKYNSIRNDFVHSIWFLEDRNNRNPEVLTRVRTTMPGDHKKYFKQSERFTVQQIQDVVEEIATLSQSLKNLIFRVLKALKESPQE
jgi:hypothetical protein